jgi:hypothetical protein
MPFPEDAVEIFRDYAPENLQGVRQSLTGKLMTDDEIIVLSEADEAVVAVNSARKKLHKLLNNANVASTIAKLDQVYDAVRRRKASETLIDELAAVSAAPGLPAMDGSTINLALGTKPAKYKALKLKPHPTLEGEFIEIKVPKVLPGYPGPLLSSDEVAQLADLHALMKGGKERDFRLGLLRAETRFVNNDFDGALAILNPMIAADTRGRPRRKFLGIRSAFTEIARGMTLYRSTRDLASDTIAASRAAFQSALDIVAFEEVQSDVRGEIEQIATAQRDRIDALVNCLGYSNQHIPKGPDSATFRQLATNRTQQADAVRTSFVQFLEAHQNAVLAEAEAVFAVEQAERDRDAALENLKAANKREEAAKTRQRVVQRKIALEESTKYIDLIGQGAKLGLAASQTGVLALHGLLDFGLRQDVERQELETEKRLADIDAAVAAAGAAAAALDHDSAAARVGFLDLRRSQLVSGQVLNADTYYHLALGFERLLEAHTTRGMELAFLAEKRAVFELGNPNVPQLQFASIDSAVDKILSPARIAAYLSALDEFTKQSQPAENLTDFDLQISLKRTYPLEYFQFLQSGTLTFKITLPELDELRPGTTNRRIESVKIEVLGLGSAVPNISARLKHTGVFMLRDAEATKASDRLLPPPDEIAAVLEQFRRGAESVAAVDGITLWQVEPAEKELTLLNDDQAFEEFANYGFTGVWEFEMRQSENPDINIKKLDDIVITFDGRCIQGSEVLREHVRSLVKKYREEQIGTDQVDHTTAVSMRSSPLLRDALIELKASGKTTFELRAESFPVDITGAKVKALLFQAIDADGEGLPDLRFVIGNEHSDPPIDRVTHPDGFSEDLTVDIPVLPIEKRFVMEGDWFIDGGANSLSTLDDLVLFFIHVDASAA